MSVLSSRERATLIWITIFFLYIITHKEMRKCLWQLVVIIFEEKLRVLWEIILLYVLVITMPFYYSAVWKSIYIKDIVIWFLFSGVIYCANAVSNEADENYIGKVLRENLKITIVLEFLMSTFTFSIWAELLIIPIVTIISLMSVCSENKEEYKSVHRLCDVILAILGFWMFYETINLGIREYATLDIADTMISFFIPIIYMFLIIPLEFGLEIYSKYENLFSSILFMENKNKKFKHRVRIISTCKFSIRKILLFQKKYMGKMYIGMKDEEFDNLIAEFNRACIS